MMFPVTPASEKEKKFIKDLKSGNILRFVGSFSPLVSRLLKKLVLKVSMFQVQSSLAI